MDLAAHMDRIEVSPVSPSWSLAKNFDPSIASKIASVYNNASSASGTITAALSGDDAGSFTLNTTSLGTIAAGESGGFSVTPNAGLSVGTHTVTLTIYENGIKLKEITLSATVGDYMQPSTPKSLVWSTTSPGLLSWDGHVPNSGASEVAARARNGYRELTPRRGRSATFRDATDSHSHSKVIHLSSQVNGYFLGRRD